MKKPECKGCGAWSNAHNCCLVSKCSFMEKEDRPYSSPVEETHDYILYVEDEGVTLFLTGVTFEEARRDARHQASSGAMVYLYEAAHKWEFYVPEPAVEMEQIF